MSIATNTTEGDIVLAGDLAAFGESPQLRSTGVTAGTYTLPIIAIDSKGRVIYAKNSEQTSFQLPDASISIRGIFKIGSGFYLTGDAVTAKIASGSEAGTAKISSQFTVDGSGVLNFNTALFPIATSTVLGYIKVGSNLEISNGSLIRSGFNAATSSTFGFVKYDPSSFTVTSEVLSANIASSSVFGVVKTGSNIVNTSGTISFSAVASDFAFGLFKGDEITAKMSASFLILPDASTSQKGVVRLNGADSGFTSTVGVLDATIATNALLGVARPSMSDISYDNDGALITRLAQTNNGWLGYMDGAKIALHPKLSIASNGAVGFVPNLASTTESGFVKLTPAAPAGGNNLTVSDSTLYILDATSIIRGAVRIGNNLTNDGGLIDVPTATSSVLGVVKTDATITNTAGVLSVPTATTTIKGVVKTDAISILNSSGVLSVPTATSSVILGVVKTDATITNTNGTIGLAKATSSTLGCVKLGNGISSPTALRLAVANSSVNGRVQAGSNINITADGTISDARSHALATSTDLGYIQPDQSFIMDGSTIFSFAQGIKLNGTNIIGPQISYTKNVITNASGTVNIDCSLSNIFDITLSGNITFTFTNITKASPLKLIIRNKTGFSVTMPSTTYRTTEITSDWYVSGWTNDVCAEYFYDSASTRLIEVGFTSI